MSENREKTPSPTPLPVVGVAAGSGSQDALQRLLAGLPVESGLALVVAMPDYTGETDALHTLLQSASPLPVRQIHEQMVIERGQVYLLPPGRMLAGVAPEIQLDGADALDIKQVAPIDQLFHLLACAFGEQAIGVMLGDASVDGALGLARIKAAGGLTVVQQPPGENGAGTALEILAGRQVDLVLPVEQIAGKITGYAQHLARAAGAPADGAEEELLRQVCAALQTQAGHDFTNYKPSLLLRCMQRQMRIHDLETTEAHLELLQNNPAAAQLLASDCLGTSVCFFRNPQAFAALEEKVIPRHFEGKSQYDTVRVWVVGCGAGEEAYSLAMLLAEQAARIEGAPEYRVFASDVDGDALNAGRAGLYPATIAAHVSPPRLQRFFTREAGGFRVRPELRERVIFAHHNVLRDPPFNHLDLVSCRNLLRLLTEETQRQLLDLFDYVLTARGSLFLGAAESIEGSHRFETVEPQHPLYQRRPAPRRLHLPELLTPITMRRPAGGQEVQATHRDPPGQVDAICAHLLGRYAPPHVVVNSDLAIVYYSKGAIRYLAQPAGEPTHHLLQRVPPALHAELAMALHQAAAVGRAISGPVMLQLDGQPCRVHVEVQTSAEPATQGFALVLFCEAGVANEASPPAPATDERDNVIQRLQDELEAMKRQALEAYEEFGTSQEEMKVANEELQAMNEELMATAEELEVSKEEVQAVNEELFALNQENANRIDQLNQLTADLQNLLVSTDIATLFLDRHLQIKRYTPRIGDLFNILPTDRGRPLAHVTHHLHYGELLEDAAAVQQNLLPVEREVTGQDDRWWLARILPYRTVDGRVDGVVITFVDITVRNASRRRCAS